MNSATDAKPTLSYPFHRTSVLEPPRELAELRRDSPVTMVIFPTGDIGYLVTRYPDVQMVLADKRFSRAETIAPGAPRLTEVDMPPGSLFTLDPPDHTRLRKLVTGAFTAKRIRDLEPRIRQVADELVEEMAGRSGTVDLNEALAFPLPVKVI